MKRLLLVIAFSLIAIAACKRQDTASKQEEIAHEKGVAPDISVISVNDSSVLKLSSLKGKVVLLNFWATWCPPCREEIPSMMKLEKQMSGKPFQMVAVSIDEGGKPAIDAFFKTSALRLPAYIDSNSTATKLYGTTGVPETFIIDKNGIIVKKVVGGMAWDSPEVVGYLEGLTK